MPLSSCPYVTLSYPKAASGASHFLRPALS